MEPPRKLGLFLATMLVAGNMVGSGIFLLPATLAQFGSMTTLGWLIATAGALIVARVLGRLGQFSPAPGGACTYAARSFGPFVGFQATATYWLAEWTGNIAIAIAAVGYLASFFPSLAATRGLVITAIALIWLLTAANLMGPRRVAQFESATFFIGLIPILMVIGFGAWGFHPAIFAAAWNTTGHSAWRGLPPALVLMFWAFAGVESASIATAVVANPERNVARATYGGVLIAAAIYVSACGLIMGLLPAATLARSTAPFADAVGVLLGAAAAAAVALMACIKAVGSLAGWILLTAETAQAGAGEGLFPRFFAHRRLNLAIAAVLMSLGVWASVSPTLGQQFGELIAVSVILTLLLYIYAAGALWREAPRDPARARADRSFAAAAVCFCTFVLVFSGATMLLWSAAVLLAAAPLYFLIRTRGPRGGGPPPAKATQASRGNLETP